MQHARQRDSAAKHGRRIRRRRCITHQQRHGRWLAAACCQAGGAGPAGAA